MKDFDRLLTMYLSEYLPVQRAVSENTVSSYCTTFKLLIHYCREVEKIQERQLDFLSLTDDLVIRFLQWIEVYKKNYLFWINFRTRSNLFVSVHRISHK